MKTKIVPIGNSQGIRIPKTLLEETGLEGEVTLKVVSSGLLIQPQHQLRDGWASAAREMASAGADALLDAPGAPSDFDRDEWTWKDLD